MISDRLIGGSGTDFGVPSVPAAAEGAPLPAAELERLDGLLGAAWAAFDRTAAAAAGRALRTGPRGGGRSMAAMVTHVLEADGAYLVRIGGSARGLSGPGAMAEVRERLRATLAERARGVPLPDNPRRSGTTWSPRYCIRRSAWHALDHAWEIEDRL